MRTFVRRWWLLGLWLGQGLVGLFLFTHYGEAWDDASMLAYARNVLQAWETFVHTGAWPGVRYPVPVLEFYGVWPWVLAVLVHRLLPFLHIVDAVHGVAFAFFWVGTAALYLVLRRWFSREAALVGTLLFATQPLLWGHGFINLKDTSAWSMMLVSLYWVLRFADAWLERAAFLSPPPVESQLRLGRAPLGNLVRRWLVGLPFVLGVSVALAWGYWRWWRPTLLTPWTAELMHVHRLLSVALGGVGFLLLSGLWVGLSEGPSTWRTWWKKEIGPRLQWLHASIALPAFWAAVLALGLSVSIRISGWWVAVMGGAWLWKRSRWRAFLPLMALAGFALVVHHSTYPSLWPFSPSRTMFIYGLSLRLSSKFLWMGKGVLFAGQMYPADQLPFWYVPWLHLIQTTEPALLLAFLGLWALWRTSELGQARFVFGLWYALPVALLMTRTPPLYDNARQLLFLLPGLYIPVAAGWEALRSRLRTLWRVFLAGLGLAPALMAWVQLHPYEYVYYNSLVGGVGGAFRRYEMDYWATSFREVASYLNQQVCTSKARNIRQGLRAVTWEPVEPLADFLCPQFRAFSCHDLARPRKRFFAVLSTRYNADLVKFPHVPDEYRVERAGAVLSVVRFVEQDPTPPGSDGVSCLPKDLPLEELSSP